MSNKERIRKLFRENFFLYFIKFDTVLCWARETFWLLILTIKSPDLSPHKAAGVFAVIFPINVGLLLTIVKPNESFLPRGIVN
jgi:uncharacterized membrane protein YesL